MYSENCKFVLAKNKTYDSTTSSVTNHEVLARPQLVKIRQMSTMHCRRFRLTVYIFSVEQKGTERLAYVMIRRRSRQSRSPAWEDCTSPAAIAASRIMSQPLASHAAGTVSHTLAASEWGKSV